MSQPTKRRTDAEKQGLLNTIAGFVQEGLSIKAAAKRAGITDVTYYAWRSRLKKRGYGQCTPQPSINIDDYYQVKIENNQLRDIIVGLLLEKQVKGASSAAH